MAAPCLPGAAPRDVGSLPSATSEQSVTPSSKATPGQFDQTFPKSKRLLRSQDFRKVYEEGFRISGAYFSVVCLRRDRAGGPRVGLAIPRRLGCAVTRNRIRRRLRESIRMEISKLPAAWDIVIHPRISVLDVPFADLRREVEKVFQRCERR